MLPELEAKYLETLGEIRKTQQIFESGRLDANSPEYEGLTMKLSNLYGAVGDHDNMLSLICDRIEAKMATGDNFVGFPTTVELFFMAISFLMIDRDVNRARKYAEFIQDKFENDKFDFQPGQKRVLISYIKVIQGFINDNIKSIEIRGDVNMLEGFIDSDGVDLIPPQFVVSINQMLEDYHRTLGNIKEAVNYGLDAIYYAAKFHMDFRVINTYLQLSDLYKMQFEYKNAYTYYCKYRDMRDTFYSSRRYAQMKFMAASFNEVESEEAQKDIKLGEKYLKEAELCAEEGDYESALRYCLMENALYNKHVYQLSSEQYRGLYSSAVVK